MTVGTWIIERRWGRKDTYQDAQVSNSSGWLTVMKKDDSGEWRAYAHYAPSGWLRAKEVRR